MRSSVKRIVAVMLATILTSLLAVAAYAAEESNLSITVNADGSFAATADTTCYAYKVMDASVGYPPEDQDVDPSYWYEFTDNFSTFSYEVDETTEFTGQSLIDELNKDDSVIELASLAEKLKVFVDENSIEPTKQKPFNNGKAVLDDLDPGYYLVTYATGNTDSKEYLGLPSLVPLIDKSWVIDPKFSAPTIEKTIVNINSDNLSEPTSIANVQVGDIVGFKLETTIPTMDEGFANSEEAFKIVDTLDEGLTLEKSSIEIEIDNAKISVNSENGKVSIEGDTSIELGLITYSDRGFTINFNGKAFYDTYKNFSGKSIVITYKVKIGDAINNKGSEKLSNKAKIEYYTPLGKQETPEETASVYSLAINVWKYAPNDSGVDVGYSSDVVGVLLQDAKFVLYRTASDESSEKEYYKYNSETKQIEWIKVSADEKLESLESKGVVYSTGATGVFRFSGLAKGVYYLQEVEPPSGYNGLRDTIRIELNEPEDPTAATSNSSGKSDFTKDQLVANSKGIVLPGTGGMGTIIFYCVGGALVIGALVILVARRRMSSREK